MNDTCAKRAAPDASPPARGTLPAVVLARLAGAVATVSTTAGVWSALPAEAKATLLGCVIKDSVRRLSRVSAAAMLG